MEPIWVALWAFVALTLAVLAVGLWVRELWRLRATAGTQGGSGPSLPLLDVPHPHPRSRGLQALADRLARLSYEAGWAWPEDASFLVMVLCGVVLGGLGVLWLDSMLAAVAGFALGCLGFWTLLHWRRLRRMALLRQQLPDVMEQLARAVKAGLSVDQAIALVGHTAGGPLGQEFRRCAGQVAMGLALPAAVQALAQRVGVFELRIFATALSVQRQTGGNLVQTLERLAQMVRDRIASQRQHQATTAAGRMSTWIVALAGPAVLLYLALFQKEYLLRFVSSQLGIALLIIAGILQLLGLLWIVRILKNNAL